MYSVVNIPHEKNERAVLMGVEDGQNAAVKVVDPKGEPPYNTSGVCELYIGDHMFAPDKQHDLRLMVAKALAFAIEKGRDAGYAQAQTDMRNALGIPIRR